MIRGVSETFVVRARSSARVASALVLIVLVGGCGDEGVGAGSNPEAPAAAAPTETDASASPDISVPAGGASVPDGDSAIGRTNALTAPDDLEGFDAARFATAGLVPATPQRSGDASRGRQVLVEEGYVACGLPLRVYRELAGDTPITTLPGRESAADGLPYFVNVSSDRDGVEIASNNCLLCHGTALFGELVIGLGNEFLDFTSSPSSAVERAGALVRGAAETAVWERYADRVHAIAPYMTMRTVGTNPANNLTFALMAHRDPASNAWLGEPVLPLPSTEPPPVSVPPWWRMAKKHAMFNLGEGRDDHARLMMSASMLCTDTIAELEAIDGYAPDIRAYIASLVPPAWPFVLDAALAERGRGVFEANCSVCHGRYATDADGNRLRGEDTYPNRLVPLDVIGSDPTLVEQMHGSGVAYVDWFNRSFYGRLATIAPGPGYVAPPLDGVWATGPFLHNGSVPSVRALLDSATRPTRWYHLARDPSDPASYDEDDLGWRFGIDGARAAGAGGGAGGADTDDVADPLVEAKRVYDTARPGHANTGHRFGDHLTDAERDAVIEYLKTL